MDSLSEPDHEGSGCLADSQAWLAEQLGVQSSFYLVNGSTVGLLAAMLACVKAGDKVLLPRNAHRALIHGLILTGATPVWIMPEQDAQCGLWLPITISAVERAFETHSDVAAVVIISPTYEGLCPDVASISAIAKRYGTKVIVDEAHGALLSFCSPQQNIKTNQADIIPPLPDSTIHQNVDVVVQSLHKSAGSLTQTALAHIPTGSSIPPTAMQAALNVVHTSSPSYVLLASIEETTRFWLSEQGQMQLNNYVELIKSTRTQLYNTLKTFQLFEPSTSQAFAWDWTKLVLSSNPPRVEPAEAWATRLEQKFRIAYEATTPWFTLYYPGPFLPEVSYEALLQAFQSEDQKYIEPTKPTSLEHLTTLPKPDMRLSPREAFMATGISILSKTALGRIAKTTYAPCPPGIPVVVPGEIIQEAHLPYLPESITVVA